MRSLIPSILGALIVGVIALVSVWAGQPLLAPSLGSATFVQLMSPRLPSATPYSVGVGQLVGLVCGFVAIYLVGAAGAPSFAGDHSLTGVRVAAVALAVLLAMVLQHVVQAKSPAGGATALVVALGMETPDAAGFARLLAGIVLVTALGELARQVVLRMTPQDDAPPPPA